MLPESLLPWMPLGPWFHAARRSWYSEYDARVRAARSKSPTDPSEPYDLLRITLKQGTPLDDAQLTEALASGEDVRCVSLQSGVDQVVERMELLVPLVAGRGHRALASLYKAGKVPAIVTQNIDNLHQASGIAADAGEKSFSAGYKERAAKAVTHFRWLMDDAARVPAIGDGDGRVCLVCGG